MLDFVYPEEDLIVKRMFYLCYQKSHKDMCQITNNDPMIGCMRPVTSKQRCHVYRQIDDVPVHAHVLVMQHYRPVNPILVDIHEVVERRVSPGLGGLDSTGMIFFPFTRMKSTS